MIRFINCKFIKSASKKEEFLQDNVPQVAIVGRSNVGKSSIINMLANNSKLAKTSSTPGRTRLVNYFDINKQFYLVDLPGYGFAQAAKNVKEQWDFTLDEYFEFSTNLKLVFVLLDSRRMPSELDVLMINYLVDKGIPYVLVLTKTDKLSKSELSENINNISKIIRHNKELFVITSASQRQGINEIAKTIEKYL
ncbi:MAG: ribosome biogenesis GTP-binding protein YihA/YsxC [Clostridia bacterium]|nr:ribosome biogenesis GTP-binding protein YihA/YsxC [Clostridia bacterium]